MRCNIKARSYNKEEDSSRVFKGVTVQKTAWLKRPSGTTVLQVQTSVDWKPSSRNTLELN